MYHAANPILMKITNWRALVSLTGQSAQQKETCTVNLAGFLTSTWNFPKTTRLATRPAASTSTPPWITIMLSPVQQFQTMNSSKRMPLKNQWPKAVLLWAIHLPWTQLAPRSTTLDAAWTLMNVFLSLPWDLQRLFSVRRSISLFLIKILTTSTVTKVSCSAQSKCQTQFLGCAMYVTLITITGTNQRPLVITSSLKSLCLHLRLALNLPWMDARLEEQNLVNLPAVRRENSLGTGTNFPSVNSMRACTAQTVSPLNGSEQLIAPFEEFFIFHP